MNLSQHFRIRWSSILLILLSVFLSTPSYFSLSMVASQLSENPHEGWAVLLEMNEYPNTDSDLNTNFADTKKWNTTLHALGWQTNHILIHQGYLDQTSGQTALQFLSLNADANDVVIFFIFAHGNWILNEMNWDSWFPNQWRELASQEKLLVVSACGAEAMINSLLNDSAPHVHLASAHLHEYSWAGSLEEGLPIIGEIFSHYLTAAFLNSSADQNNDGDICVEEAFAFASPLTQTYISSVVFPAYPYFADMCNSTAATPVMDDNYPGNFSLTVELGNPPITFPTLPHYELTIILIVVAITAVIIFFLTRIFIHRRQVSI